MDCDHPPHNRRRRILLCLLVAGLGGLPSLAEAGNFDFPERIFSRWKPTWGRVITDSNADERKVREAFSWTTWVSLQRVADPRTTDFEGMYEHELHFRQNAAGEPLWCDRAAGRVYDGHYELPEGLTYHDDVDVGDGEFTWGMHTYSIEQDEIYKIRFKCRALTRSGTSRKYSHIAQLAHCHVPCTEQTAYPDESATLIGHQAGQAPETREWRGWFEESQASFEEGTSSWHAENASKTHRCAGTNPYHGDCYVELNAQGNNRPSLRFNYHPQPSSIAAEGSPYSEFAVRCPSARNSSGCPVRARIWGMKSNGDVTLVYASVYRRVVNDNQWRWGAYFDRNALLDIEFPPATDFWKLELQGGPGVNLDVDFHQQALFDDLT